MQSMTAPTEPIPPVCPPGAIRMVADDLASFQSLAGLKIVAVAKAYDDTDDEVAREIAIRFEDGRVALVDIWVSVDQERLLKSAAVAEAGVLTPEEITAQEAIIDAWVKARKAFQAECSHYYRYRRYLELREEFGGEKPEDPALGY